MLRSQTKVAIALALGLSMVSARVEAQDSPETCISGASQTQEIEPQNKSSAYFDKVSLHFVPLERSEIAQGYFVGRPELVVSINWDSFIAQLAKQVEVDFRKGADDNNVDYINSSFDSVDTSFSKLSIHGSVKFEKWAKWNWTCCRWFKCRKCEAKTRLFSKTLHFVIDISKDAVLKSDTGMNYSLPSNRIEKQKAAGIQIYEDVSFASSGHTTGSPGFIEQLFDVISGTVSAVTSLWGDPQLTFETLYHQSTSNPPTNLNSTELLNATEYDYGYDEDLANATAVPGHRHRGFWQAFFASLSLDPNRSGFVLEDGSPKFTVSYGFNLDHYYALLAKGGVSDGLQTDVLYYSLLCGAGKTVFSQYLAFIRDKYAGVHRSPTITIGEGASVADVSESIDAAYGLAGISEYYNRSASDFQAPGSYVLPPLEKIVTSPSVVPISGNLWAMALEFDWSKEELRCAIKEARARSGDPSLIYPLENFSLCLQDGLSDDQRTALEEAERRLGAEVTAEAAIAKVISPILGSTKYRGWYYCYTTTSVCAGKQVIVWFDDLSKYDARAGSHKGIDLIDTKSGEESSVVAVANGNLIYSNKDLAGWGHALLLPFKIDDKEYFAVYAHLAPSVLALDGKHVTAGDVITKSACTGNAGDGNGTCNNYCHVNGALRTDNHLHFEVIERGKAGLTKVDPLSVLPFAISEDKDKTIFRCDENNALLAKN